MRRGALALVALVATLAPTVGAPSGDGLRILDVFDGKKIGATVPLEAWSGKPLSLADVDGDGDLDILAQNANQHVYAIDPRSGRALVEVAPKYPYGPDLGPFNGPRAADLDDDGVVELVDVDRAAGVTLWRLELEDGRIAPRKMWARHLDELHGHPSADAGPIFGDLDRDGKMEIVVQTEERGTYALRADGTTLWTLSEWGGNAEVTIVDLDRDEDLDVIVWTDGGVVHALEGATGKHLWRYDASHKGVWPGSIVSRGIAEDLDGDGRIEVAFCARNVEDATPERAPGAPRYSQHHFALFLLRDGKLVWMQKPSWGNPMCSAYLMAHDVDGDGRREILGLDWNTIGHKPGNWERLGPAHAFAFDVEGKELWHRSIDTRNAKYPIALADVRGDADQELVAYDDGSLVLIDPENGALLATRSLDGRQVSQGILAGDLFGDGRSILVVPTTGRSPALVLLDAGSGRAAPAFPGWWEPPEVEPLPPPPPTPTPIPATPTVPAATPEVSPPIQAPGVVKDEPEEARATPGAGAALALLAMALLARGRKS